MMCPICGAKVPTGQRKYCSTACRNESEKRTAYKSKLKTTDRIKQLESRILELEEENQHFRTELKYIKEYGTGLLQHMKVSQAQGSR